MFKRLPLSLNDFQNKRDFDVWLTVHRSSMWNKKPTRRHLVFYLFLLYKLLNMFRATLRPSLGADDLVVFFAACGVVPWLCRQSDPVGWLCPLGST